LAVLQVQNSISDFLSSPLVPELRAYIATSSASDIHFALVSVFAIGALPKQLAVFIFDNLDFAVISTTLAVVALGV
jgi:hypothetical protein